MKWLFVYWFFDGAVVTQVDTVFEFDTFKDCVEVLRIWEDSSHGLVRKGGTCIREDWYRGPR